MIYCVEDDAGIRDIEVYTLKTVGYDALGFHDSPGFFAALETATPKLVILDIMLPGEDGIEILRRLKKTPAYRDIPVIMATARGAEYDKIIGLDLGADDYLVKPFGMMEMVSRVRAVLRRASPKKDTGALSAGGLTMNDEEHTVTVNGERIDLALKEYEILKVMLSHPGVVFTRDQLLTDIWGQNYDGETRTVDVHVRTLRQKLGECAPIIETVRGVGYRIGGNA